jgi:hypothetical protein
MISYFIFISFSKLIDVANLRIYSVSGKIRSNKVLKIQRMTCILMKYSRTKGGKRRVKDDYGVVIAIKA